MPNEVQKKWRLNLAIQLLARLASGDGLDLIGSLIRAIHHLRLPSSSAGLYEVLEHDSTLELLDAKGSRAVLHKYQKVRFLQDQVNAYKDTVWGDGDLFASYQCSPGMPVDTYRAGHRWRVLISLRETRNRGDQESFHIERTIRDGFTRSVEDYQAEVDHRTRELTLRIIFPQARPPKQVWLIEQNAGRSSELGPVHRDSLSDGRVQVSWSTDRPRLYEAYILRWRW